MTKAAFDKIKAGLGEAKAYLDGAGNKRDYGIHVPARVNVKKIRTRLGLSQETLSLINSPQEEIEAALVDLVDPLLFLGRCVTCLGATPRRR